MQYRIIAVLLATSLFCALANAHHSFAAHYLADPSVSISGLVTEYRFRNPHGLIFLEVLNEDGVTESWRVETNSPSVLRRRGWSPDSLHSGDAVTIVGYPARDNTNFIRVYRVMFSDGRELTGQRPAVGIAEGED